MREDTVADPGVVVGEQRDEDEDCCEKASGKAEVEGTASDSRAERVCTRCRGMCEIRVSVWDRLVVVVDGGHEEEGECD